MTSININSNHYKAMVTNGPGLPGLEGFLGCTNFIGKAGIVVVTQLLRHV